MNQATWAERGLRTARKLRDLIKTLAESYPETFKYWADHNWALMIHEGLIGDSMVICWKGPCWCQYDPEALALSCPLALFIGQWQLRWQKPQHIYFHSCNKSKEFKVYRALKRSCLCFLNSSHFMITSWLFISTSFSGFFFVVLRIESTVLCILDKCPTSDFYLQNSFMFYLETVPLSCQSDPWTHTVAQRNLELKDIPASVTWTAGIMGLNHQAW